LRNRGFWRPQRRESSPEAKTYRQIPYDPKQEYFGA
jgi:hypothetical protein